MVLSCYRRKSAALERKETIFTRLNFKSHLLIFRTINVRSIITIDIGLILFPKFHKVPQCRDVVYHNASKIHVAF